jgi:2,4-dienoyl-CoA reductase-like NADH-dependent reductase (Old Yellow Enzyme family)
VGVRYTIGLSRCILPLPGLASQLSPELQVAMYEHLSGFSGGPPNEYLRNLYALWAKGGWGMIITGNVQVDRGHLSLGRDMVVPSSLSEESLRPLKQLANTMRDSGDDSTPSLIVMQLSHGGRQSANGIGGRWPWLPPIAPSAVAVGSNRKEKWLGRMLYRIMFTTPKAMDETDIDRVVEAFVKGARLAHSSGFDGIELHASHGCKPCEYHKSETELIITCRFTVVIPFSQDKQAER